MDVASGLPVYLNLNVDSPQSSWTFRCTMSYIDRDNKPRQITQDTKFWVPWDPLLETTVGKK